MSDFKEGLDQITIDYNTNQRDRAIEQDRKKRQELADRTERFIKGGQRDYMRGEALARCIPSWLVHRAKYGHSYLSISYAELPNETTKNGFLAVAQEILQELEMDFVIDTLHTQVRTWWGEATDQGYSGYALKAQHLPNRRTKLVKRDGKFIAQDQY